MAIDRRWTEQGRSMTGRPPRTSCDRDTAEQPPTETAEQPPTEILSNSPRPEDPPGRTTRDRHWRLGAGLGRRECPGVEIYSQVIEVWGDQKMNHRTTDQPTDRLTVDDCGTDGRKNIDARKVTENL